jgi:hypothetical protein
MEDKNAVENVSGTGWWQVGTRFILYIRVQFGSLVHPGERLSGG